MSLVWTHAGATTKALLRQPTYVVPTLVFPVMFYLFFGVPLQSDTGPEATAALTQFCIFATLGVATLQFGVGAADDRRNPWDAFLRTLPLRALVRFTGRSVSAFAFAVVAAALVVAAGLALTPAGMPALRWPLWAVVLAASSLPFVAGGLVIGYGVPPGSALAVANLVYLSVSFLGALWIPPDILPSVVNDFSPVLPTRELRDLAIAVADGTTPPAASFGLIGWTIGLGALAILLYRREQRRSFS
jgi:ABC-2 type transport system permease protein